MSLRKQGSKIIWFLAYARTGCARAALTYPLVLTFLLTYTVILTDPLCNIFHCRRNIYPLLHVAPTRECNMQQQGNNQRISIHKKTYLIFYLDKVNPLRDKSMQHFFLLLEGFCCMVFRLKSPLYKDLIVFCCMFHSLGDATRNKYW